MKMKNLCFALMGLCGLLCTVCSCSTGEAAAAQVIGAGSSQPPVFLSCKAVSETEIDFQFSLPVKVVSLRFTPELGLDSVENGKIIRVHFSGGPGPGERLIADLLAEDERGNTINVLAPLRTRNNRIPSLRINELRTEYSNPKAEFIEFKMLSAGNLGALRVYIAGNYKNPQVYEFGPVDVADGEYVVLHLRKMEEASQNEYGGNLDESGGTDAAAGARDIWVPGTSKLLRKTDAVYVLDQDDQVIDAVMLAEASDPWWNKDYLAEATEFLFKQGAWKSAEGKAGGPVDAVNTFEIKTALTKSVSRDENAPDTNTAADWHVTTASGITPGKLNK